MSKYLLWIVGMLNTFGVGLFLGKLSPQAVLPLLIIVSLLVMVLIVVSVKPWLKRKRKALPIRRGRRRKVRSNTVLSSGTKKRGTLF